MILSIRVVRFAFARRELVVVFGVIALLFTLLLTHLPRTSRQALNQQCIYNLQHVGLAFRQWPIDSSDKYAMQRPAIYGGSMEAATNGGIFQTFVVMSNELNAPKLLICPSDTRKAATNFGPGFANSNVSYFVGVTAEEMWPQMLLAGDRNLTNGPLSANRLLRVNANSAPGWNHELHRFRGNVSLSDGSVQSLDTPRLRVVVTNSGADNLLTFP